MVLGREPPQAGARPPGAAAGAGWGRCHRAGEGQESSGPRRGGGRVRLRCRRV